MPSAVKPQVWEVSRSKHVSIEVLLRMPYKRDVAETLLNWSNPKL